METLELSMPVTRPTTLRYTIQRLDLNWGEAYIHSELLDEHGNRFEPPDYQGEEARTLMRALNTANLSIRSLHRRYLERLVADEHIDGVVIGTPD